MLRYEFKYFVPNDKLHVLRSMIEPYVYLDKNAAASEGQEYTVRSIYFETPDFTCYDTKVEGIKNRIKVRLRGYDKESEESVVFLEIKRKYEDPILKDRAPLTYADALHVLRGASSPEDYVLPSTSIANGPQSAKNFMYYLHSKQMQPVVKVIYEREPWLGNYEDPANNLRITFDKNLRACAYPTVDKLYEEEAVTYTLQDCFILEVKFNERFPRWMRPILGTLDLKRQSASKYCMCIDSLYPLIDVQNYQDTLTQGRFFSE